MELESKPLRARRIVVRLGSALVLFHSTNLAVRTRTRLHVDFEAYTAFGPQATNVTIGRIDDGTGAFGLTTPTPAATNTAVAGLGAQGRWLAPQPRYSSALC